MQSLQDTLQAWNKRTSERVKLQHTYLCITVIMTILSGLVALLNADLGHKLIIIPGIAIGAFLANALVWALTKTYVIALVERKKSTGKSR